MSLSMIELGDPVLRTEALPVEDIFSSETQTIIDGMIDILKQQKGIGLAAPQVGVSKQIFIVAPDQVLQPPHDSINNGLVVINPSITFNTNDETFEWEGCLSIPGIRGYVPRPCDITIDYTNRHGEIRSEQYTDFIARIFLHEYDHLYGTVFIDRLQDLKYHLITDQYYMKLVEEAEKNQ